MGGLKGPKFFIFRVLCHTAEVGLDPVKIKEAVFVIDDVVGAFVFVAELREVGDESRLLSFA